VATAVILNGLVSASAQAVPVTTEKLGQLEITVSRVEQFSMTGDRFEADPISSPLVGHVYFRIKNVGDFPVRAALVAPGDEYKGAE
jgi:hypothetical protein